MTRLALSLLLVTLITACGAPAPGTPGSDGGVDDSWVRAGERACRNGPETPTSPRQNVETARASRIGVWNSNTVIPLERALGPEQGALLVLGLDVNAIQRCDFSRFPASPICVAANTCGEYTTVHLAGFVVEVAREFIRTGRCW